MSFPDPDEEFETNGEMGEIESPKAVSVLYAPVGIKIVESNEALEDDFSVINQKADETWMFKVELLDKSELDTLMTQEEYDSYIKGLD